jgi:hypothetical protein
MPEVGLVSLARHAVTSARTVLPRYRSTFSKHQFTHVESAPASGSAPGRGAASMLVAWRTTPFQGKVTRGERIASSLQLHSSTSAPELPMAVN